MKKIKPKVLAAGAAIILVALIVMVSLFAHNFNAPSAVSIRVACVGDSITEASGYPNYLQVLLGSKYIVGNFGVSGSTATRGLESSYMDEHKFQEAKNFAPDAVVIMMGTNDASLDVYEIAGGFEFDYKELVSEFQALKSKPQIWLVKPPPIFNSTFGPDNAILFQSIIPGIERVANQLGLPTIDVYSALINNPENFFADGVHPNSDGARIIATEVKKAIASANISTGTTP